MLQCNCSIIGDPVTREALVSIPATNSASWSHPRHRLTVKPSSAPHAHIDHVALQKFTPTTVPGMMHSADLPLYHEHEEQPRSWACPPRPDDCEVQKCCGDASSELAICTPTSDAHAGTTRQGVRVSFSLAQVKWQLTRRNFLPVTHSLPAVSADRFMGRLVRRNHGFMVNKVMALPTKRSCIRPRTDHHHRRGTLLNPFLTTNNLRYEAWPRAASLPSLTAAVLGVF